MTCYVLTCLCVYVLSPPPPSLSSCPPAHPVYRLAGLKPEFERAVNWLDQNLEGRISSLGGSVSVFESVIRSFGGLEGGYVTAPLPHYLNGLFVPNGIFILITDTLTLMMNKPSPIKPIYFNYINPICQVCAVKGPAAPSPLQVNGGPTISNGS